MEGIHISMLLLINAHHMETNQAFKKLPILYLFTGHSIKPRLMLNFAQSVFIQKNSFKFNVQSFRNPHDLTLVEHGPKVRSSTFYQKNASPLKQASLRDMFRKASQECLYISCYGISWPLASTPTFSAMKTTKQKRILMTLNQQIQVEYSCG